MISLTKGASEGEALLSRMMKNLGTIGVRSKVKRTKRKEGRNLNLDHGVGVEVRGGAGREARQVYREEGGAAQGAGEASQGVMGVTEWEASLKREAFQGRGPNPGAEKQADQEVNQDQDQGPKNLSHAHQSGLARIDEGAGNSRDHIQDLSQRALKALRPLNQDRDRHQTRRRG